jgi:hypothetical protein
MAFGLVCHGHENWKMDDERIGLRLNSKHETKTQRFKLITWNVRQKYKSNIHYNKARKHKFKQK